MSYIDDPDPEQLILVKNVISTLISLKRFVIWWGRYHIGGLQNYVKGARYQQKPFNIGGSPLKRPLHGMPCGLYYGIVRYLNSLKTFIISKTASRISVLLSVGSFSRANSSGETRSE